ncbi:MAG TPA: type II toxin-antitoxin system VapC family toxin [Rhizomicrobium sp.]
MQANEHLHAPHLLDVELTQTLRRLLIARQLTAARAEEAFEDFGLLAIERHEHRMLLARVWALKTSLSSYDAVYVVLAESLDAPLLTCDERLARTRGHDARIDFISPH